ncbi:MAG: DUF4842 domain-containing protein [Prevotella sp.]|nr:DUF4842 domain-containing protein [Prevotella sp.]
MRHSSLLTALVVFILIGCTTREKDLYDPEAVAQKNAEKIFGSIDYRQDWKTTSANAITITADADLDDIVKVQILTAPPFGNTNAVVLCEGSVRSNGRLTLNYDVPSHYSRLFAACVNSKGIYHIKGFKVGQPTLSFASPARSRVTRGTGFPQKAASEYLIERRTESFNKQRTDNAWGLWAGSNWNDCFYELNDGKEQELIEKVENFTEDEKLDLQAIFDVYLQRDASKVEKSELINGRPDNLYRIKNSTIFTMDNNYLTSNGETFTVTPVGMASPETREGCRLFYFYFDPAIMQGKSEAEQVQILKNLPKYKAEQCWRLGKSVGDGKTYGNDEIFREDVYYCPYYGDGEPTVKQTRGISYAIPKGYKIGFTQRMMKDSKYTHTKMGELYGDGRLNNEINLLPEHFTSAKLQADDPRQAIFSVNGKTYITFEDGSDRQFSDLIIEVNGIDASRVEEAQQPSAIPFTMCFEDRPTSADYDMNDVVLQGWVIDERHVKIALVACGANDALFLHGIDGTVINEKSEIHALFGLTDTNHFINTTADSNIYEPVIDIISKEPAETLVDRLSKIWVENKTAGTQITLPTKSGEAPKAIIVPIDFPYPMEKQSIINAYRTFRNWAQNVDVDTDWYLSPTDGKTFPKNSKND